MIAEDEILQREGLTLQLERAGFEVAGVAANAPSLERLAARLHPDVVLTDIRMPPGMTDDGLQAALRIRREQPAVGVVVLSHYLQRRYAVDLLGERPGGVGYLLKQRVTDPVAFCADLRRVAAGATVLDPTVVTSLLNRARRADVGGLDRLTSRQSEVLSLMAQGHSNMAIARILSITEKSVVHHASNIYDALGLQTNLEVHRRVLAVVRYLNG